jgi:hypothetical protein
MLRQLKIRNGAEFRRIMNNVFRAFDDYDTDIEHYRQVRKRYSLLCQASDVLEERSKWPAENHGERSSKKTIPAMAAWLGSHRKCKLDSGAARWSSPAH